MCALLQLEAQTMKLITNKSTITILAIGLLASGCASNSNDTPIIALV